jgi:hypothetical protein
VWWIGTVIEVWVVGARQWRNPETHLPADFDLHRDVHYEAIAQPLDPTEFVTGLRDRVDGALARFAEALRTGTSGAKIGTRKHQVWITGCCCVKPSRDLDAADFPPRC